MIKKYKHVFKVNDKFEMKMTKDYHYLYLKYDVLLLAGWFFSKIWLLIMPESLFEPASFKLGCNT